MTEENTDVVDVESKLKQQNALAAAIGTAFWSIPILFAWYYTFQLNYLVGPLLLFISGPIIGLAVRFHGKGYTGLFSALAFFAHAFVVLSAYFLGLILGEGEQIWAIFLAFLYALGAWLAMFIARKQVPFRLQKVFFTLTETNSHESAKKTKNKWFVVLPVLALLNLVLLSIPLVGLSIFSQVSNDAERVQKAQKAQDKLNSRAIETTKASLSQLSEQEALLHAYAFYSGSYYNEYGAFREPYPRSTYKALTIVRYLSEQKNNQRARYIQGILTLDDGGTLLIKESAQSGDIYARIHLALQQACYGKPQMANDMLFRLYSVNRDQKIRRRIDNIISDGFEFACQDEQQSRFLKDYMSIRN